MIINTEIPHVTKPGTNLLLELGFDPAAGADGWQVDVAKRLRVLGPRFPAR